MIHRDLKSLNILISEQDNIYTAKLCDFGLVTQKNENNLQTNTIKINTDTLHGTILWMAPELFKIGEKTYSIYTDSYAFGIILFEILEEDYPFKNNDEFKLLNFNEAEHIVEFKNLIKKGTRPKLSKIVNDIKLLKIIAIMNTCLNINSNERYKFKIILDELNKIL
jgi:serine/threonine protein kinase